MYKSPTDPKKQRSGFYLIKNLQIEGADLVNGKYLQQLYLDNGRMSHFLQGVGGPQKEEIAVLMGDCKGFKRLVESISIWVISDSADCKEVTFHLKCYGKKDRYNGGTVLSCSVRCDGSESRINLSDISWSDDDDILGSLQFAFAACGQAATATVRLHLAEGYVADESMDEEEEIDFAGKAWKKMISDSLVQLGNTGRLKRALKKAENGEDMTIAFIGGSITQGAGAKPISTNCYAYRTYMGLVEKFSKGYKNIHFVKAGVGGTPSELGLLRYDREVCKMGSVHPDIVVVEFAVNDNEDELMGGCYESLVRKIYYSEDTPAVVLLFSVFEDDWNLQERLIPVGKHYKLPMVSVKNAVVPQFYEKDRRVLTKRQYFYDIYHPSNTGHRVMADCLLHLLTMAEEAPVVEEPVSPAGAVYTNELEQVIFFDRSSIPEEVIIKEGSFTGTDMELQMVEREDDAFQTPEFPDNWKRNPAQGDEPFCLKVNSKNLLLIFKDSGSPEVGTAEVWVDDELVVEADPHFNNWTHCNTKILFREEQAREHTVIIRMSKRDLDKTFTILGFGYTK